METQDENMNSPAVMNNFCVIGDIQVGFKWEKGSSTAVHGCHRSEALGGKLCVKRLQWFPELVPLQRANVLKVTMPNGGQYIINEVEVDTLETNLLIYTKNSNLKSSSVK